MINTTDSLRLYVSSKHKKCKFLAVDKDIKYIGE